MDGQTTRIIQAHSQHLDPIPTDVDACLRHLPGIRAVLFDIYGTLLISASGDFGTTHTERQSRAFEETLTSLGIGLHCAGDVGVQRLRHTIRDEHARLREHGVEFPEVDILEIWRRVLRSLSGDKLVAAPVLDDCRLIHLALEYEVRTNPVWPMPGAVDCLAQLDARQLTLGVVSNAQAFTRDLFPALLNHTLEDVGVTADLQIYSFAHRRAKPGVFLFHRAVDVLATRGIEPHEALFVGNDMLNDIAAAARAGLRTALFAGDRRSLRLRKGDVRVEGVAADVVLTELDQLPGCLRED